MSRAAEAWEVEGGGEVKERERERERWREEREGGSESKRGTRACAVWSCRAATLVLLLLLEPLLLLLLEGCALKRRCAGCGPSEPLLHPEDCPSLACLLAVYCVCTCTYSSRY
jgi:hypothetical protein